MHTFILFVRSSIVIEILTAMSLCSYYLLGPLPLRTCTCMLANGFEERVRMF